MTKEFIEEIIFELSYRVSNGIPDLKNEDHLYVLREIMEEKGISFDVIESVIDNLREKRLLTELESFGGPTRSFAIDFDGTHSSGSLNFDFKNYDPEIKEPVQDDEAEAEDDGDEPVKEESYIPTYIFDPDKMGIVETGNSIPKNEVLSENKFKCFMTGEVFLETTNGTLVKELDYLDNTIEELNEDWWADYSEEEQQKYIQDHPASQKALDAKKKKEKDVPSGEKDNKEQKDEMRNVDHEETTKALMFTKTEAETEKKTKKSGEVLGRGLGTPESRAGEAATHYAIRQLIAGKNLDEVKNTLTDIANQKDTYLKKEWVNSSLNATKFIVNKYGAENIDEVVWDTPSGRKLIGVEGHMTPSDMFITTKDGKRIGISLKKDGDVYLVNSGYKQALLNLLEGMNEQEKQKITESAGDESYKKDRNEKLQKAINVLDGEMKSTFNTSLKYYKSNIDEAINIFGPNYGKYLDSLDNMDSIVERANSGGKLKTDEIKAFARIIGRGTPIYEKNPDLYNDINLADYRLIGRLLKNFEESPKFAVSLKKFISKRIHISELLNLEQNPKLDEFITVYGESPDGVELSKKSLLELFGEKTTKLYEIKEGFEKAKTPEEKKKYSNEIMKSINNSIYIDFKDGAHDGVIKVKHEDGKEYPIFTVGTRTRGIGAATALEIHQTSYMANALKFKTFDVEKWNPLQRNNFFKRLKGEYEERLKDNKGNPEGIAELQDGIKKINEKLKEK